MPLMYIIYSQLPLEPWTLGEENMSNRIKFGGEERVGIEDMWAAVSFSCL